MFGESKTLDTWTVIQVNRDQVCLFNLHSLTWGAGLVWGLQLINLMRNITNNIVLLFNILVSIVNIYPNCFHRNNV